MSTIDLQKLGLPSRPRIKEIIEEDYPAVSLANRMKLIQQQFAQRQNQEPKDISKPPETQTEAKFQFMSAIDELIGQMKRYIGLNIRNLKINSIMQILQTYLKVVNIYNAYMLPLLPSNELLRREVYQKLDILASAAGAISYGIDANQIQLAPDVAFNQIGQQGVQQGVQQLENLPGETLARIKNYFEQMRRDALTRILRSFTMHSDLPTGQPLPGQPRRYVPAPRGPGAPGAPGVPGGPGGPGGPGAPGGPGDEDDFDRRLAALRRRIDEGLQEDEQDEFIDAGLEGMPPLANIVRVRGQPIQRVPQPPMDEGMLLEDRQFDERINRLRQQIDNIDGQQQRDVLNDNDEKIQLITRILVEYNRLSRVRQNEVTRFAQRRLGITSEVLDDYPVHILRALLNSILNPVQPIDASDVAQPNARIQDRVPLVRQDPRMIELRNRMLEGPSRVDPDIGELRERLGELHRPVPLALEENPVVQEDETEEEQKNELLRQIQGLSNDLNDDERVRFEQLVRDTFDDDINPVNLTIDELQLVIQLLRDLRGRRPRAPRGRARRGRASRELDL